LGSPVDLIENVKLKLPALPLILDKKKASGLAPAGLDR